MKKSTPKKADKKAFNPAKYDRAKKKAFGIK